MASLDEMNEPAPGLEDQDVVTKYKLAGEIATKTLAEVVKACIPGAKTIDLCKLGDKIIHDETASVYNTKKDEDGNPIKKGVAFPTCVSVNHCVCHNSPLESDPEIVIAEGDVVKIDLGVHVDGFIAPVATTVVAGVSEITGRKADAVMAAYTAAEVALRMLVPGAKTNDVTEAISKVAEAFNCKPVENMLSHQVTRNKINGEKAVIQNPSEQLRKEHKNSEVEVNEVYAIDVLMSTGEGKPKESEQRTTVFKNAETPYKLKMKASRTFFTEMSKRFSVMPFTLRAFEDEKSARLGVTECVKHDVVDAFKILEERDGEFVAQFKILCMVMPNGNIRGTVHAFDAETVKSELSLEAKEGNEELIELLKRQVGTKNKKKKKKSKAKAEATDEGEAKE